MKKLGSIIIENLEFTFEELNQRIEVFRKFSLEIKPREIVVILGPSGCGKSTLIKLIAGFLHPQRGRILIDGEEIKSPSQDCGVVFQNHNLFPWKTVKENIEFGLQIKKNSESNRKDLTYSIINEVGLIGFENLYPFQLSGGMAQRVAFARTIVNDPKVILLDEPFGSLDSLTRSYMREFFLQQWKKYQTTVLFITHDIEEALLIADRIILLNKNPATIIQQILIENPRPTLEELINSEKFRNHKTRLSNALFNIKEN